MNRHPFVNASTATKSSYREAVWDFLEINDIAEFPRPVKHRIPNFKESLQQKPWYSIPQYWSSVATQNMIPLLIECHVNIQNCQKISPLPCSSGANGACDKCATLNEYKSANVVKVNPDKPQQRIRYLALQNGKTVLVPTPRLQHGLFNKLVLPNNSKEMLKRCASSEGVRNFSTPIGLHDKVTVDCVVIGSVAVSHAGYRIGKGEGFADLEYAMMRTMGAVDDNTTVITTVHDCQVFKSLPEYLFDCNHDVPVDYICTPTRIIKCDGNLPKPKGIVWQLLTDEQLEKMPVLKILKSSQSVTKFVV